MPVQKGKLLFEKHFEQLDHPLRDAVQTLLMVSDYACRQLEPLKQCLTQDDGQQALDASQYLQAAAALDGASVAQFQSRIRFFRQQHLLRLLLRELAGLASTEDSMRSWSDCADALILTTMDFCQQQLASRYGLPCDEQANPCQLYALAMGKLGGRELNY